MLKSIVSVHAKTMYSVTSFHGGREDFTETTLNFSKDTNSLTLISKRAFKLAF